MKNSSRWTKVATTVVFSFMMVGSLSAQGSSQAQPAENSAANAGTASGGAVSLAGSKKRIAVGVCSGDSFGIADQLTTELVKTGRFIVVERTHMEGINQERDLGSNNQVTAETAAQGGQLLGAQLIIACNVVQSLNNGPKAINVGFGGFRHVLDNVDAGLGKTTEKISLDIRLLDATSGHIVYSFRVEGKASGHGAALQLEKNSMNVGGSLPQATPAAEAARKAVLQAVAVIVQKMPTPSSSVQATGQVIDVIDGKIYITCGADSGIRAGDTLAVSSVLKQLIDPSTGLSLGNAEQQVGEIHVETVNEKYSVALPVGDVQPKRGDLVRIKPHA
jgi:curli biogenesis system outer membrane secretion channel CsgG